MKTKILSYIASAALVGFVTSCGDVTIEPQIEGKGSLSFEDFGVKVEQAQSVIESRAGDDDIDVSGYLVTVTNKTTDKTVVNATFGNLPGVVDIEPGTYTIQVQSHRVQKAEWDNPYYAGKKEVVVENDKVTDAGSIECKFSSIRVSVTYSEKLRALLGDDVKVTVDANDAGELVFTRDEKRSGYFEAVQGSTTLVAHLEGTINGVPNDLRRIVTDVKAGQYQIIRFYMKNPNEKPDETGTITPGEGISIETSVEVIDQAGNVTLKEEVLGSGDRPGQETPEPVNPDNPDTPTPPADDDKEGDITIDKNNPLFAGEITLPTSISGRVEIGCKSGLNHLYLTVTSTNESFSGIANYLFEPNDGDTQFDMTNPKPGPEQELTDYGLECGAKIKNKETVVFDISNFIPLLVGFPGTHTFALKVVSNDGSEASRSITFIAKE